MRVVVLIDGGYLRASAQSANKQYDAAFVSSFVPNCVVADEYMLRVLYYDAPPFKGRVQLPVSGLYTGFRSNDTLLDDLAKLERFAVRVGTLGFRGWKPRLIPIAGGAPLTDADFKPVFEQKGVDMRVGLDITAYSNNRTVDRIILVSGDQDMIPAMKHARKSGLEVTLIQLPSPARPPHDNLLSHSDIIRSAQWP